MEFTKNMVVRIEMPRGSRFAVVTDTDLVNELRVKFSQNGEEEIIDTDRFVVTAMRGQFGFHGLAECWVDELLTMPQPVAVNRLGNMPKSLRVDVAILLIADEEVSDDFKKDVIPAIEDNASLKSISLDRSLSQGVRSVAAHWLGIRRGKRTMGS